MFDEMILNRGGMCDICGKDAKLCVDHDHKTGVVRGLLCIDCNTALEVLERPTEWTRAAKKYLTISTDVVLDKV